jgi:hypothetical protein
MNNTDCLTNEDKIFIITKKIKNNENKYYDIFNGIIEKYNLEHSINKNGIFLNLSILEDYIIDEIYIYFTKNKIIEEENDSVFEDVKKPIIIHKYEKDKLNLDKFDKYLLKKSIYNITI